jgi:hypothetical protein
MIYKIRYNKRIKQIDKDFNFIDYFNEFVVRRNAFDCQSGRSQRAC